MTSSRDGNRRAWWLPRSIDGADTRHPILRKLIKIWLFVYRQAVAYYSTLTCWYTLPGNEPFIIWMWLFWEWWLAGRLGGLGEEDRFAWGRGAVPVVMFTARICPLKHCHIGPRIGSAYRMTLLSSATPDLTHKSLICVFIIIKHKHLCVCSPTLHRSLDVSQTTLWDDIWGVTR